MHQNMHKKFLAVSVAALCGVIVLILILLNVSLAGMQRTDQTELLDLILRSGGDPRSVLANPAAEEGSEELTEDTGWSDYANIRSASYFLATTNGETVTGVRIYNCPDLSEEEARTLVQAALLEKTETGTLGVYAYKELVGPSRSTYAFLNISRETLASIRILMTSIGVGALGLGLVLVYVTVMAAQVLRPAQRHLAAAMLMMNKSAAQTQKGADLLLDSAQSRGVADAREDMLEGEHLHTVASELRAVFSSFEKNGPRESIDLSTLLKTLLGLFEGQFQEMDVLLHTSIDDGIQLSGRMAPLREMLTLLLQNVCGNLTQQGNVFVDALQSAGKIGIIIRFSVAQLPDIAPEFLFTSAQTHEGSFSTAGLLGAKLLAEENGVNLQCSYLEPADVCFTMRLKAYTQERSQWARQEPSPDDTRRKDN